MELINIFVSSNYSQAIISNQGIIKYLGKKGWFVFLSFKIFNDSDPASLW